MALTWSLSSSRDHWLHVVMIIAPLLAAQFASNARTYAAALGRILIRPLG
jgi:hypothetical protein